MDVDLMVLQQRCRRDPLSYRDDFLTQRRHFNALLTSTSLHPSAPSPRLTEVATFMGTVAPCYADIGAELAPAITALLTRSGVAMYPDTRRALVKLLALLRARGAADAAMVIPLFFRMLACPDKQLRRMLHGHIVSDVKRLQASGGGGRRQVQAFLFGMVDDRNEVLVKRCLHVLVDLFRKKVWNDAKCANMIAKACFYPAMPVALIAIKFMLDSESKEEDWDSDDDDEEEEGKARQTRDGHKASELWKVFNRTGKKSSKKRKRMERVINRLTKVKSNASGGPVTEYKPGHPAFEAMMLINDPQDFAERLFSDLQNRRRKESYETRLVMIDLISRLVGTHELILFNFYPFLQRYLQPAQPEVTKVLACLVQACHEKVSPDVLHPILRGLADSFVSERSSPLAVAAGINTIREICSRVPLSILDEANECKAESEQEAPLLEDLVQYKSSKDKGVMMAARSLIALYREVHPGLLHKKDRGRAGAEAVQKGYGATARAYGQLQYATGVEGVDLLNEKETDDELDESDGGREDANETSGAERETLNHYEEETGVDKDGADGCGGRDSCGDGGSDGEEEIEDNGEDGREDGGEDVEEGGGGHEGGIEEREGEQKEEREEEEDSIKSERYDTNNAEDEPMEKKVKIDRVESGDLEKGGIDKNVRNKTQSPQKRQRLEEMRILSNEEFARIRAQRAAKAIGAPMQTTTNTGDAVDPDELQGPVKRERRTVAERVESVLQGREGREKFGSRKGKKKGGGSTNKQKLKTKSNAMVIHKRRKRSKMSRREKQLAMRKKKDYR